MADRLALPELCAPHVGRALRTAHGTGPSALGAGLSLAPRRGLSLEEDWQGALVEPGGGGLGDLLPGIQVEAEAGAVVAEGAAGDDVAPLGGQGAAFLEFLGGAVASRHGASCLGVRTTRGGGFYCPK